MLTDYHKTDITDLRVAEMWEDNVDWVSLSIIPLTYRIVTHIRWIYSTRRKCSALRSTSEMPNSFRSFPLVELLHPGLKSLNPRILFRPNELFAYRSDRGFDAGNCSTITRIVGVTLSYLWVCEAQITYRRWRTYVVHQLAHTWCRKIENSWARSHVALIFYRRNSKLRLK